MDGEFSRAGSAARGKQIGQIRAGDQQHQCDRADKQSEIGPIFADEIFQQRCDDRRLLPVGIGISFFQTRRDRLHLGARLINIHSGFEFAPDVNHRVMRAIHPCRIVAAPHHRQPDICVLR